MNDVGFRIQRLAIRTCKWEDAECPATRSFLESAVLEGERMVAADPTGSYRIVNERDTVVWSDI